KPGSPVPMQPLPLRRTSPLTGYWQPGVAITALHSLSRCSVTPTRVSRESGRTLRAEAEGGACNFTPALLLSPVSRTGLGWVEPRWSRLQFTQIGAVLRVFPCPVLGLLLSEKANIGIVEHVQPSFARPNAADFIAACGRGHPSGVLHARRPRQ